MFFFFFFLSERMMSFLFVDSFNSEVAETNFTQ